MKLRMLCALMLALLLALTPALAEAPDELTALAAQYVTLIGLSEADVLAAGLDAEQTLAGEAYDVELLYDADALYGVRLARTGLDEQAAHDDEQALIAMARAEYGEPDTYPVENTADVREYWYFARPEHFTCEIAASGDAESGYAVSMQFALSILPGVDYVLSDATALYIEQMGRPRADVYAALGLTGPDEHAEAAELLGVEYDTKLLFSAEGDALCGVTYAACEPTNVTDAASALYMQAAQEYGSQDVEAVDAVPFIQALSELEAGAEVVARWSLPTADGSLTGLYMQLIAGIDTEGVEYLILEYASDDIA